MNTTDIQIDTSADLNEWMCFGLLIVGCCVVCWLGAKALDFCISKLA